MSKLIHEQDSSRCVAAVAMARQRAKERIIAEEAQDQGVAIPERCIDRRSAMQHSRVKDDHVSRSGSPGKNIIVVRVSFSLRLYIGEPGQGASAMQRCGGIVGIEEVSAIIENPAM